MIEINLVPDVKQEYLHSQRLRAKVIFLSLVISASAVAAVVLLGMYIGAQAVRNMLADNDIKDQYQKLTAANPDLGKAVTIQNQLVVIPTLNNKKPMTSRLFDLLTATNPKAPNNVKLSTVTVDPNKSSLIVEGTAEEGFNAADAFKKTLLNSKVVYNDKNNKEVKTTLTSAVTITNTSFGQDTSGKKVLRFKMSFNYPKELLSNEVTNVRIETPTGTVDVTDSRVGVPDSLFAAPAGDIKENK